MYVVYFFAKLFLTLLVVEKLSGENINCVKNDYSWYTHRGMNTNYDDVRGYGNLTIEGCKPLQMWGIFRHGMRNGKDKSIIRMKGILLQVKEEIVNAHNKRTGSFCYDDIEDLTKWNFDDLMMYESSQLMDIGRKQSYKIGDRIRDHFSEILNISYDPTLFYFGHSGYQRTFATLRAFVEGFFRHDDNFMSAYVGQYDRAAEYDCNLQELSIHESDYEDTPISYDYAEKTNLFKEISESLSKRSGVQLAYFDKLTIIAIYDACILETGRDQKLSPWCKIFSRSDLERLRLREDIFHYSNFAYGNDYAHVIGCSQIRHLVSSIDRFEKNKSDSYVFTGLFSHDAVIDRVFTRLGCFKTELDGNYLNSNFAWDISSQTPQNANLLAVLYRCEKNTDFKLQLYLNEKPLGCCLAENTEACSWNEFRSTLDEFVLNCKEDFCEKNSTPALRFNFKFLIIFLFCLINFFS